jgi:hypothetical protein
VDHSGLEEWTLDGADSKFTFTRASTATYFDAIGIMQTALADELRIDYDPETGECLGTLIEEARTNLLTYSEDFSNAAWGKFTSSISANATTAPDGTTTMDELIENSGTAEHHVRQNKTISAGEKAVFSIFAKANTRNRIQLRLLDLASTSDGANTTFDLSTGTVVVGGAFGAGTEFGNGIEDCGGGIYRCWIAVKANATITTAICDCFLIESGTTRNYAGDGTSGLYIWGAQLEAGAFPTSYIPTTTAAVTRNADVITMTGVNFSDWYNQSEGTVFVEATKKTETPSAGSSAFPTLFYFSDGTTNNRIAGVGARVSATESSWASAGEAGGVVQWAGLSITTVNNGTSFKLSSGYKIDNIAASVDGGAVSTDSSASIPTTDRLHLGANVTPSQFLNGHIKQLQYYPRRLTNTQLQALSA